MGQKNTHALELLLDQAIEDWNEAIVEDDCDFLIYEYSLQLNYATIDEREQFNRLLHQRGNIIARYLNDGKDEELRKNEQQIADLFERIEGRVVKDNRTEKLEKITKLITFGILFAAVFIICIYKLILIA